jgi:hypothetical protein
LAGLGAKIPARPDIDMFEIYRAPKPLIRKQFLKPQGNRRIYDVQIIDPEDPDYVPPPEEPKSRRRALAR